MWVTLQVNDRLHQVEATPGQTLLPVLRDQLGLTGAKQGCGTGHCGACTVLVAGRAVQSCQFPLKQAVGKEVITIEGLDGPAGIHPVQQAFLEVGAVQCGFCTPGMVLRVKALLDSNPRPDEWDIRRALRHNYCRCTGYQKIVQAVQLAATRLLLFKRLEPGDDVDHNALAKVTGQQAYSADYYLTGMQQAVVLWSEHHHGRVRALDSSAACRLPGVTVITAAGIPGENRIGVYLADQPLLVEELVRSRGDALALVVAPSLQRAREALALIRLDWEVLPALLNPEEALQASSPLHPLQQNTNLLERVNLARGDALAALAGAAAVVTGRFTTPANEHCYLEPDAGVAYLDGDGRVVVRTGTQGAHEQQHQIARVLGLHREMVRVIHAEPGGAFGGRVESFVPCLLGLAAYVTGKPVQLALSRQEVFRATAKRHPFVINARLGADSLGNLAALEMEFTADTGAYAGRGPLVIRRAALHASGPYQIPNLRIAGQLVYTNNVMASAMRGFGIPQVCFALESLVDDLAQMLKIDPLELRRRNLIAQGEALASGQILDHDPGLEAVMPPLKQRWQRARAWQAAAPAGVKRGIGVAFTLMGLGKIAQPNRAEAWLRLEGGGQLRLYTGAVDIGQGLNATLRQLAAHVLNQQVQDIQLINNDTMLTPDADITCSSRATYYPGRAVMQAAEELKQAICQAAGKLGIAQPDLAPGEVFSRNNSAVKATLAEIFLATGTLAGKGVATAQVSRVDWTTGQGRPYEAYTGGGAVAEVEVDEAGRVQVQRLSLGFNAGRALNPGNLETHLHGGAVMGWGFAMTENYQPDYDDFSHYRIPLATDLPEIDAFWVEVPHPRGPLGAVGVAEMSMFPVAPAIANALQDGQGVRITTLPLVKGGKLPR